MNYIANVTRSEGDPKILSSGPSSLSPSDRLGRALGWFSLGLGLAQLIAPRRIARALGMQGREALVCSYGAREVAAGMMALSPDRTLGLWGRLAGDGLDLATLMAAYRPNNPKRDNVGLAIGLVVGVTVLDFLVAQSQRRRHARADVTRSYGDRSGFPRGIARASAVAGKAAV